MTNQRDKMDEIMKQLEEGVASVYTSENYLRFLDLMSNFHQYSLNNCLLILSQFPSASRVASYRTWQKCGCNVVKGSKGIKILVPITHKFQKEKETTNEDGETIKEIVDAQTVYFKIGHVFDQSQVQGEIESPCKEIDVNSDYLHKLVELIIKENNDINYDFELKPGGANGYCRLDSGEIFLRPNLGDLHTLKTIIHEKSHQLLHANASKDHPFDRSQAEIQAESCAYVVLQSLQRSTGMALDSSCYSFPYIATWAQERELSQLKSSLETIKDTSNELVLWITKAMNLLEIAG